MERHSMEQVSQPADTGHLLVTETQGVNLDAEQRCCQKIAVNLAQFLDFIETYRVWGA